MHRLSQPGPMDAVEAAPGKKTDASMLRQCTHKLFEIAVRDYSSQTAVICGEATITFHNLNAKANLLAKALIKRGITRGDVIGVYLDRSVDLIVALLAVMKAGATYVPVDTALPSERINTMIADACPRLILTGHNVPEASEIPTTPNTVPYARISDLTRQLLSTDEADTGNINISVDPSSLAYIMYTSGSTGQPKGVEVSHESVANLLLSMQKDPGFGCFDRLLAVTTVSFDMAVLEILLPLISGGTVVMTRRHEQTDPLAIVNLMIQHKINVMQGTPAIWQILLDSGWDGHPRLDRILCGGERLPRSLADRLLSCGDHFWNMYGPTEATVYACIWKVEKSQEIVVGSSVTNCQLHVLDDNLIPVPPGSPGELYIGGAGVAQGYRNKEKLTSSRFLQDPFQGGKMYRTGDLACWIGPDKLSILGRIDDQVKIRGHRVELGEIENALTELDGILGAVVILRAERLVAYYLSGKKTSIDSPILREWLARRLPAYMIPAFFVRLQSFPLNTNGKIDRKALPDPVISIAAPPATAPTVSQVYGSELEQFLAAVWSSTLEHSQFDTHDNFFEVGGDSVRLIRVQTELKSLLDRHVPVAKLFENYTIATLASYLANTSVEESYVPEAAVAKESESLSKNGEDIAIIATACRLPGGITTSDEFWTLLNNGDEAITDVPEGRWGDDDHKDFPYCRKGGFISRVHEYDTSFFGISPREARMLDPAQYMMLETCWEAFERAGYTLESLRGSDTGTYIGTSNILAHLSLNPAASRDTSELDGYTATGSAGGTMSGRIAYQLGLEGPTMTVDTACSSSLVSTHLACTALRQGECDLAVSGGVSLMLNSGLHAEFDLLNGMSPDGRCRAFSADTQGTGWAEGSAAVILKRVSDAKRDGDTIHAVIRATAVNHDGRSATLTTPRQSAQSRLIRKALGSAQLQPTDIDYIEAHGTGTRLGDPIEGSALAEVFATGSEKREDLLHIGSVKSNIGHTQATAGLAGLLKVVLSMRNNKLPKSLHISQPTPAVDWDQANMSPVLEARPWLPHKHRQRRAGVSAFGIGGTNAHVIIEEAPTRASMGNGTALSFAKTTPYVAVRPIPFVLSAETDAALSGQASKLHKHICSIADDNMSALFDIAFSLASNRTHFRRRLVLMAKDKADLLARLDATMNVCATGSWVKQPFVASSSSLDPPKIAMLFTGQGSQWPGMGKELSETYPLFRDTIHDMEARFSELDVPLTKVMWAKPDTASAYLLDRTDYAQPALFALGVALWKLWQSWGVSPHLVLGHSLGEITAAHVAGVLDLADACRLVHARARLMQAMQHEHLKMISLEGTAEEVQGAISELDLGSQIEIALHNSPNQTVISGRKEAADEVADKFSRQDRKVKTVTSGHAFHSRYMDSMLEEYRSVADTINFRDPSICMVSSLNGTLVKPGQVNHASYWTRQAREAVRFTDGVEIIAQNGIESFLEIGPRPILCGLGAACLDGRQESGRAPASWLPSLSYNRTAPDSSWMTLYGSAATLHKLGVALDWGSLFSPYGCHRVELPTYAFDRDFDATPKAKTRPPDPYKHSEQRPELCFEVVWRKAEMSHGFPAGTWGLLPTSTNTTWANSVVESLSHAGMLLVNATSFYDHKTPQALISIWDPYVGNTSEVQECLGEALKQLQIAAQAPSSPPIIWITHHAVGTGNRVHDDGMRVGASPLWGLMRTVRSEHPEMDVRLIDLVDCRDGMSIVSTLAQTSEPECAIREQALFVPRMQRAKTTKLERDNHTLSRRHLIRPDGAVLITGGLGYLGKCLARWLTRKHGVRDLILTSRKGLDTPGASEFVSDLSHQGSGSQLSVEIVAGDIADPLFVRTIMAKFSDQRPLRAVFHAAGVSDSGLLASLTPERCLNTLNPKALGAWALHEETKHLDLDVFFLFSSISGVMGMPGLANYAASNTFLDALAHSRQAQGLPATSVAFGTWAGDGMASELGQSTLAHLKQFGLHLLTPDEGLDVIQQCLTEAAPLTVAAALDLKQLSIYATSQGGIPPLLNGLLDAKVEGTGSKRSLHELLLQSEESEHLDIVLRMVREVVAGALGHTHAERLDVDCALQSIGVDSLTAVQTRNHLATLTGLALSVNVVFHHRTLRALSQYLHLQLLQDMSMSPSLVSSEGETEVTSVQSVYSLNTDAICRGCLDDSITFNNIDPSPIGATSVLVTGATGFVGAFIIHGLLQRGIEVHAIVRADNIDRAQKRLQSILESYGLWDPGFASLLKPVIGDISKPLLGLPDEEFHNLAQAVDSICHSAALVDWMRPLDDYIGPNIISTHEILRLASYGRAKTIHVISTMSTLPKHLGFDLTEKDPEYGYGTSKYVAERLVAAARWRGANASVYRLPYVTASTSTGSFRLDRGDFLHNMFVGSLQMGALPQVEGADMSAVLPVNYLSETVVRFMTDGAQLRGRDYDFRNMCAPTCDVFFKTLAEEAGRQTNLVPFGEWKQLAAEQASRNPQSPLARIYSVLDNYTDQTSINLFKALPPGEHVLGGTEYPAPELDAAFAAIYAKRMGFGSGSDTGG